MSDTGMTPEEIAELRAERDALQKERDLYRQQASEEGRRADGLHLTSARREAETAIATLTAQEQAADATIASANTELAALRRQWADFQAEGKFEEAAEVNEKIGDATARRQQASSSKGYFSQQREQAQAMPTDPVDRFLAANQGFNEAEQAWIKRNPRYATDAAFRERVNRAHTDAISASIEPQSPDYFERLVSAGYNRPLTAPRQDPPVARATDGGAVDTEADETSPYSDAADDTRELEPHVQTPPPRPAARSVAAAPSRRSPTTPRQPAGGNGMSLTREQAEMAIAMSEHAPPEVQDQGEAGLYEWWAKLNTSPTARRLRDSWAQGA